MDYGKAELMGQCKIISAIGACAQWINPAHKHGVHPYILDGGWEKFIDLVVEPELEWGVSRILLYNPFSGQKGNPQFDQYQNAKNAGLATTQGFFEAWKPIIDRKIEVIAYYGNLSDKDFTKRRTAPGDYAYRIIESVRPILNVGMSVAVDEFVSYGFHTPEYSSLLFVEELCRPGSKLYFEGWPFASCDNLFRHNFIFIDQVWYEAPKFEVNAKLGQLTGEIIRWADRVPDITFDDKAKWHADRYRQIIADGHTPMGATEHLRKGGFQAKEFV